MAKLVPPSFREVMQKLWDCSPITDNEYYATAGQVAAQLLSAQEEREPSDDDRRLFESFVEQRLDVLADKKKIKRVWVFGMYGYRTLQDRDNRCKGAPFKKYWFREGV